MKFDNDPTSDTSSSDISIGSEKSFSPKKSRVETWERFQYVKQLLKSLSQAVKVLREEQRPTSKKLLLKCCNEAILTYSLYENPKIVSLAFSICKSMQDDSKDLVNDTILKLLAFPDIQVKTSAYIELHTSVQVNQKFKSLTSVIKPKNNTQTLYFNLTTFY